MAPACVQKDTGTCARGGDALGSQIWPCYDGEESSAGEEPARPNVPDQVKVHRQVDRKVWQIHQRMCSCIKPGLLGGRHTARRESMPLSDDACCGDRSDTAPCAAGKPNVCRDGCREWFAFASAIAFLACLAFLMSIAGSIKQAPGAVLPHAPRALSPGRRRLLDEIACLCVVVAGYSLIVKWAILRLTRSSSLSDRKPSESGAAEQWLAVGGSSPPTLRTLDGMQPDERLDGAAIQKALTYSSLLDLLTTSPEIAFEDTSVRAPLRHAALSAFVGTLDFSGFGLGPGDCAACLMPNGSEAAVLLVCCLAKCVLVPLNPASTCQEILLDLRRVRASVLIVHRDYMEHPKQKGEITAASSELGIGLVKLSPDTETTGQFSLKHAHGPQVALPSASGRFLSSPEDRSLMLFTSGTSGSKKCVPYTLNALVVGSACIIASWELRPEDKVCNMMPLFHVGGITRNVLSPVLSGGSAVLCDSFDPVLFWDILEQRKEAVTWYYAGPVMHQLILEEFTKRGLPHYKFRFVANAAGGLLPSLALEMRAAYGCSVLPGYGMTECMPISAPPLDYKLDREGTSGRRVGPQLKVFNDAGEEVPAGMVGNVVVRGPPLFDGYEGDAQATEEAFFPGGWFNTGDLGWLDHDGYLYITGASKEVINRGGEIISPFEVEEAIQSHPRIRSVLAFSVPHKVLEQGIGILVVPEEHEPRVSLRSVHQWCKQRLTFAKWPQVLVLVPDLPKNHSNKSLRVQLAKRLRLTEFWGGAMVDGMSEVSRTFLAGCPAKGTPLDEPIPEVRMLHLSMEGLGRRLQELGMDLGVREVAVTHLGAEERLCACVVPEGINTEELLARVRGRWDDWDVPLAAAALPELPREGPGGPLDRAALVRCLEGLGVDCAAASDATEEAVQRIWAGALRRPRVSVDADFFDLGGTSLLAGPLALALQRDLKVGISSVDVFNAPTVQAMSALVRARLAATDGSDASQGPLTTLPSWHWSIAPAMPREAEHSWDSQHPLVLAFQLLPLFVFMPVKRIMSWVLFLQVLVWTQSIFQMRSLESLVVAVLVPHLIMRVASPLLFIAAKWSIVGKYKEGHYPLFGSAYLKWWLVSQLQHALSRGIFGQNLRLYYRLLGAQVGVGANISSTAMLSEFDLLNIGAGVALHSCTVRPFSMTTDMCFTLVGIHIGDNTVVCAKSVVAGGAKLPAGTAIGPLSSSHELQDARPENRKACLVLREVPPLWLQVICGWPILLLRTIVSITPVLLVMKRMTERSWYAKRITSIQDALAYTSNPERMSYFLAILVVHRIVCPCVRLSFAIVVKRHYIGKFTATPDGTETLSSWELFRTWLLKRLIPDAHLCGVTQLLGRHYECVSALYRLIGVKVGKHVYWPGSGFHFMEPDLVEIGDYVVFGSRSMCLTSDADHCRRAVRIEAGSNVSDRCVLMPGVVVKTGAVLGSGTLTEQGATYAAGTYVGSCGNGCIVLKRSIGKAPAPCLSSYAKAFTRNSTVPYALLPETAHVVWNVACNTLAAIMSRLSIVLSLLLVRACIHSDWHAYGAHHLLLMAAGLLFLTHALVFFFALSIDIGSKWLFLGRRRPGSYAWDTDSYNQCWQLYLALAPVRSIAAGHDFLGFFRGSQFLVWYFRSLGAKIGKNVCLYPNGADPMMTEPELVTIGDKACVDDASLIAHLNTGGLLTTDHLQVGQGCVMRTFSRLQQGAVMEPGSALLEHTLVLPADTVRENEWRQGWPAGSGWIRA